MKQKTIMSMLNLVVEASNGILGFASVSTKGGHE